MRKIKGIAKLEETSLRVGGNGDNWHMTWAGSDKQYVSLCDGEGFPGTPNNKYNSRTYAIDGDPPEITFEYLPGYPDLINNWGTQDSSRYYCFGILALDETIYQYLTTPNHPFQEPGSRFAGVKLIYSPDSGNTWHNQDGSTPVVWERWDKRDRSNMVFFFEPDEAFSLITVLQMGRNYRQNTDGFVYLYAPNGNTEGTMNQLVLCRVPKDRLLDRSSYEFFSHRKPDGSAEWKTDINHRGVVYTFPSGWVNTKIHPYAWHPSVVYYEHFGVYLMANWGMGCAPDGEWFGKPSYLGFWTAPEPWGPWRQIHEDSEWTPANDQDARAYQPQISPKWIAKDGLSFWMVWTDFQLIGEKRPYYAFNTQKVQILVD